MREKEIANIIKEELGSNIAYTTIAITQCEKVNESWLAYYNYFDFEDYSRQEIEAYTKLTNALTNALKQLGYVDYHNYYGVRLQEIDGILLAAYLKGATEHLRVEQKDKVR